MKKSHRPRTRVKNPEPPSNSPEWVIWAAWADRITFEEIEQKTGKSEIVAPLPKKQLSYWAHSSAESLVRRI